MINKEGKQGVFMANRKVIVIGGGAAGMTAAIAARRAGAAVTILEKNPRVGKKILATGNGRCNFTNVNADIPWYHGNHPSFVKKALQAFTVEDTLHFFKELGIEHKVEEAGKVFPMSDQASSVLDVLLYEISASGIEVITDTCVSSIAKKSTQFELKAENGSIFQADSIVLAAGGKAMPSSGSDGNGYELAIKLGHTMTSIFPALVQLMLEGSFFQRIEGVKFVGTAQVLHHNRSLAQDRGDILFANYGVSGPPILQISRKAAELLQQGKEAMLKLSVLDIPEDDLKKIIDRRCNEDSGKTLEFSLVGLINKRLIPVILHEAGIEDIKKPAARVTPKERMAIVSVLTDWRFKVRGTKSWPSAQVTAGGINTDEIDDNTMESKIVPGLYLVGEIVDIDGQCGGFNLQWAWSSGYVAGKNAAL